MKYKIKEGIVLPSEFKIKVNPDQSIALQEYLISIGCGWYSARGDEKVRWIKSKYLFKNSVGIITRMTTKDDGHKEYFRNHEFPRILFENYFEEVSEGNIIAKTSDPGFYTSEAIVEITTKDQMYNSLRGMQYAPSIAEELSGIWAEHVNRAYRKGLQDFVDSLNENNSFVVDTSKGTIEKEIDKKMDRYVHGNFKIEDVTNVQQKDWTKEIDKRVEDLKKPIIVGAFKQYEGSRIHQYPHESILTQTVGRVNRPINTGVTNGCTPEGHISYEHYLSEKEIEDNGEEIKIHTHIFCPVPLHQFIENLDLTAKLKGVLIIDTIGNYFGEMKSYIYENFLDDLSSEFIRTGSDKFIKVSNIIVSCYIDGTKVTVIDAREKSLFIGKELVQWQ